MFSIVLATALGLFGFDYGAGQAVLVHDEEKESDFTAMTFDVKRGNRVEVRNFNGDVRVLVWKRNSVRIEADHDSGVKVGVESKGSVHHISALLTGPKIELDVAPEDSPGRTRPPRAPRAPRPPRVHRFVPHVDYEITVPSWIPLSVFGVNTDVEIEGLRDEIVVQTINGDVYVRGGGGRGVDLSSTNGEVFISGARGRVRVNSINDDVNVEEVVGNVFGEAVNGDIVLRTIRADTILTTTVRGDVFYEGAIQRRGKYLFSSHTGDIQVLVPKKTSANVFFYTFNGDMSTTFPVTIQPFESGSSRKNRMNFQLGRGGAALELKTFSGDIELDWLDDLDSR